MKKYKIFFHSLSLLAMIPILYFLVHWYWRSSMEVAFQNFNSSGEVTSASLHSIVSSLGMKKYDYVCVLDFYQTSLKVDGVVSGNKYQVNRKVNLLLSEANFRKNFLSFSRSEGSQALVFFNEEDNFIRIEEISKNRVSLVLPIDFLGCSEYERIYLSKETDAISSNASKLLVFIK